MDRLFAKFMVVSVLLSLSTAGGAWLIAASDGKPVNRPLDLPNGGKGYEEEEEEVPETITFYGQSYEGDGFFFCLDKSGSMTIGDSISEMKSEVTDAISGLTEQSEFALVAFSTGWISWKPRPHVGTTANRTLSTAWVQSLEAGGQTYLATACIETIRLCNMSDKEHKQIIVLSDGEPNNPGPAGTLSSVTSANWRCTPIHTVYLGSQMAARQFMQQLAAMNHGEFSRR